MPGPEVRPIERKTLIIALVLATTALAGCVGQSGSTGEASDGDPAGDAEPSGSADTGTAGDGSAANTSASNRTEPREWADNRTETGNLPASTPTSPCRGYGNLWAERQEGVNYNNHSVAVNETVYAIEVVLDWTEQVPTPLFDVPDLDMCLFAPDGSVPAESRTGDVGESVLYNLTEDDPTGDWTVEIVNYAGVDVDYELTTTWYHRTTG